MHFLRELCCFARILKVCLKLGLVRKTDFFLHLKALTKKTRTKFIFIHETSVRGFMTIVSKQV